MSDSHEMNDETQKELSNLCGEILATIRANFLRETIKTTDDNQFKTMLDRWSERLRNIK